MDNVVKFAINDIHLVEAENYPTDEFAIAKVGFLGSNPNAHKLRISNDVLKEYADTVLGKFLVADINPLTNDATTHTPTENIKGYFPREQEVVFVEEDGYVKAYADAVVSKVYASDFCDIFENGDDRSVSVEMQIETVNDKPLDDEVVRFNIVGVTALGKFVKPSCPDSDMEFIRFSEQKAQEYFENATKNKEGLNIKMAEENYVNHPIDTSKNPFMMVIGTEKKQSKI